MVTRMIETTLEEWGHFHDWYLDTLAVGRSPEPGLVQISLYRGQQQATVIFQGVTGLHVSGFGLLNIVNGLRLVGIGEQDYGRLMAALDRGDRLSKRRAKNVVCLYSTLGAEIVLECDSLTVVKPTGP